MSDRAQRGAVVLSIADDDDDARRRLFAGATDGADLVEIRADRLDRDAVLEAVRRSPLPVIVTARARAEGGAGERSEDARFRLYRDALEAGAHAVDVEVRSPLAARIGRAGLAGLDPAGVIASLHGERCDVDRLRDRARELAATSAARRKLVARAERVDEIVAVRRILGEVGSADAPLACFATGTAGSTSRLLALAWGSWATYGSVAPARATAEGQCPVRDLVEVHRVGDIGPATRLYALIGGNLERSPSPAMHADAYRRSDFDARYLPIATDDLDAFDRVRAHLPVEAVGVTIPHKEAAARRCTALDGDAAASGSVNTVRFDGPDWSGWNTDASGLRRLLRARRIRRGVRAVVVGAGGTGRTAARVLLELGARVTMVNRGEPRGRAAAAALGASFASWSRLGSLRADVWVRAVPELDDGRAVLPDDPGELRLVVDYAYAREPTATSLAARRAGIDVIDGLDLLAAQAVDQLRRMTGADADERRMRAVASAWLGGSAMPDGPA